VILRGLLLKGVDVGLLWVDILSLAGVLGGRAGARLAAPEARVGLAMQRLLTLIRKELIELRRDPRLFAIVIVAPLVQLTLLGYAATTDVRDVPLVVADEDRSAESRALVSRFEASQNFVIAASVSSASGDRRLPGLGPRLDGARHPGALRRTHPQRPAGAGAGGGRRQRRQLHQRGAGYAGSLIAGYNRELAAAAGRGGGEPLVSAQVRVWFNPQLESRFFIIPGVLALLLLVVTTNLSSMAIVREKELGTLEQLNVTPLRAGSSSSASSCPTRSSARWMCCSSSAWRSSGSRCRCAAA
jgi:ABC-2 type transport system permease protein